MKTSLARLSFPLLALASGLAAFALLPAARAQSPGPLDLNEGLVFSRTPSGVPETPNHYEINFWGKAGRTYVVEETDDLTQPRWRRLPGLMLGYESQKLTLDSGRSLTSSIPDAYLQFDSNPDRQFIRLRHVDNLIDPFGGDYDRDGVSNYDEVASHQTDPFAYPDEDATDSEPDGLPDAWERWRTGGTAKTASDTDAAGNTYAARYAADQRDTDADGLPDDWEKFRCAGSLAEGASTVHDGKTNLARFREDRVKLAAHKFGAQEFRYHELLATNAFGSTPENPLKVFLRGNQGGSMIVTYSNNTYSDIAGLRIWPSNGLYGYVDPDIPDLATHYIDYTGTVVGGAYDYVFSLTPATGDYVARDLLRSLHGRPLRRTVTAGVTHLALAPLAITSRPLLEARPDRFPIVLRDFPYQNPVFPNFGGDFGLTGDAVAHKLVGGPLHGQPVPDPQVFTSGGSHSGQSLTHWFTLPDAFAFAIERRAPDPGVDDWQGISTPELFFPHGNDVGSLESDLYARQAFTIELHLRLDYDLADTEIQTETDDNGWLFIDGFKVGDDPAHIPRQSTLADLRADVKSRHGASTPFLETSTGSCVVDLFHAERYYYGAYIKLLSNSSLKPIYVYQVVADADIATPLTFTLTQKPSGMTIDVRTGKILWDYYGVNSDADPGNNVAAGSHTVTVVVTDTRGHSDSQTFGITLTL